MRLGQGPRQPGQLPDQVEPGRLQVLRRAQARELRADLRVQADRRRDAADPGEQDRRDRLGGPQPKPRRRDHGQCSLASGQQLGQVIAGVVGGQAGQPRHNGTVGEYCLDTEQLGPGGPVTDRADAAGVRGYGAADGGRVPGGQGDPVFQAGRCGVPAQLRDGHPGSRGDLGGEGIDRVQPAQPAGGQQHRRRGAARAWH